MTDDDPYLDYAALSLDSNTFSGQRYNFDGGILKKLEQFHGSPVDIIQSDVIHFEGVRHLSEEISQSIQNSITGLRELSKYSEIGESGRTLRKELKENFDAKALALKKLEGFYEKINAKVISAENVNVKTLMEMYFSTEAPFESRADKKNEFPDAVALLALQHWAITNDKVMVVVSKDKGWHAFAANSKYLHAVENLPDALALFQPHTKVNKFIERLQLEGVLERNSMLFEEIESEISQCATNQNPDINATSFLNFEYSDVQVEYKSHQLARQTDSNQPKVNIVLIEDDLVVLSVRARVDVQVEASFAFLQYDSIDRDYVALGGDQVQVKTSFEVDVLIHFSGNWEDPDKGVTLGEVEVVGELGSVDFGDIAPDYSNEREDEWEGGPESS